MTDLRMSRRDKRFRGNSQRSIRREREKGLESARASREVAAGREGE